MSKIILAFILVCCVGGSAYAQAAQGEFPDYGVWVTTQDYLVMRTGPSQGFAKILTLDPVVTLPAIGRTADSQWIQVVFNGQAGWVFAKYLVWTGNVIQLPVDGIPIVPFVRRATAVGVTTRETPLYASEVTPEDQVGVLPAGTRVELTGRLGGDTYNFFRIQIRANGNLYWVGSWNIRIVDGNYRRLLDTAYLIPYGRLLTGLESNIAAVLNTYNQIDSVWTRLDAGEAVSCAVIPAQAIRTLTDGDVNKEPSFRPAVVALDQAVSKINTALATFSNACADPSFVLTSDVVNDALETLDEAERYLLLSASLIQPLKIRNPLIRSTETN
jgi:uncharacterized protein YraI